MKKKFYFQRVMVYIITVVMVIGLMNGFVFEKKVQAGIWYTMPSTYQSDYRNWNQGTSRYSDMRKYGCLVTAQAKMLYEIGVNRGELNPDTWYNYLLNNGGLSNMYMQPKGFSSLVTSYAAQYGKSVEYLGSWNASDNQLWFNINAGYYTIINVGGHYVLLDNQTSRNTGILHIYDSATGAYGITSPITLASRYSGRVEGHVYKVNAPVVIKPDTPTNVRVNKSGIGLGDAITVSWDVAARATSYNVKLICTTNGSNNQSRTVGGTSTSFSINKAGTYKVEVSASNSAGTSGYGSSGSVIAHENVIVKYVDWNGDIIGKEQSVRWGGNANPPTTAPEREGYTFQNWSSDGKNVQSNIVIEAIYKINSYAVTFVDYNGEVIGKVQKVEWSSSAVEPTNIPTKNGYIFAGWDTNDYKCVKKALTVKATYVWENTNLPIITEIESAKRNEEATGYNIKVNLTNFPNDFTKGKLVFALITKEGKMVASEIKSISMPKTEEISETATILYSGLVSRVQVSMIGVADDDTTGTPKAKVTTAPVDVGNKWSDWSASVPTGEDIIVESRDEYRYKDSKTIISATQPITPDGYSLISKSSTGTYTEWGNWSGWSDSYISSNTLRNVGTQSVVASYVTQWNYKRWLSADGRTSGPTNGTWGGKVCSIYQERGWGGELACVGSQNSNQAGFFYLYGSAPCWYYPWTRQVAGSYKTQYRYRTRSEYYNYTYKENEFSEWQADEVTASDTREVETRKTYRFKTNSTEVPCYNYKRYKYTNINNGKLVYTYTSGYADSMEYPGEWEYKTEFEELKKVATVDENIELYNGTGENSWYKADVNNEGTCTVFETKSSLEDQKGKQRTLEGKIEGAAGKVATLMVYKGQNTDPIASQIEYIGQVTIGEDGSYKFNYTTKEEPTVKTGDFVITLGIEGSTNYQVVGRIEAPKQVFTVDFVDDDGNSIGEQKKVADGGTVEAPSVPEKEGLEFIGWDTGLKNVRENMVVTAQYKKKKCTVIFVDWDKTSIEIKEFDYGDTLSSDHIPEKAGQIFDKWVDVENKEVKVVKNNMIVEASYRDTKYTVKFLDWNGEVISEQELNYGDEAELPKEPTSPNDNTVFLCWDNYEQLAFVQRDLVLTPKYEYIETTYKPLFIKSDSSTETEQVIGLYSLNSDVEIYYKIEESDEDLGTTQFLDKEQYQKYSRPLVISSNSIIRAYATSDNANDSEIVEYVVDFSQQTENTTKPDTEFTTSSVEMTTNNEKTTHKQEQITKQEQATKNTPETTNNDERTTKKPLVKLSRPKFKVKAGKKRLTITVTKVEQQEGIHIYYRAKGHKKWKVKVVKSKKNIIKSIKKLKKKKLYYVKVRAYRKLDTFEQHSMWSKTIKIKTK